MSQTHDLWLELSIPAEWERIDRVREAVASSLGAVYGSGSVDEILSMVSTELLENAIKYGTPGKPVRLRLHSELEGLTVSVSNHVASGSAHASKLSERIVWLSSFTDPREAYAAALQRVYATVGTESDGGLGIARIFHEGQCKVACERSGPEMVTVTAHWPGPGA